MNKDKDVFNDVSINRLEAYLDGTLDEAETARMDALVDSNDDLKALIDAYFSIQIQLANAKSQEQDTKAIDLTAITAIQHVIEKVDDSHRQREACCEASSSAHDVASKPSPFVRYFRLAAVAACVVFAVVLGYRMFSPYSLHIDQSVAEPLSRDACSVFGEEYDYEAELSQLDSAINLKEATLPSYPFFDRFRPEKERAAIAKQRCELYELQWRRIFVLSQLQDRALLKEALLDFVKIDGFHRDEAQSMLRELEDE